jgi:hypothetical protein
MSEEVSAFWSLPYKLWRLGCCFFNLNGFASVKAKVWRNCFALADARNRVSHYCLHFTRYLVSLQLWYHIIFLPPYYSCAKFTVNPGSLLFSADRNTESTCCVVPHCWVSQLYLCVLEIFLRDVEPTFLWSRHSPVCEYASHTLWSLIVSNREFSITWSFIWSCRSILCIKSGDPYFIISI